MADKLDLRAAMLEAGLNTQSAQKDQADQARTAQEAKEAHDAIMKERCDVVAEIMAPLLEEEKFLKMTNEKSDERIKSRMNYPRILDPYHPPKLSSTVTQNYLQNHSSKWQAITEAPGAFVLFRHHDAIPKSLRLSTSPQEVAQDSEVKIILGLSNISAGDYSGVNFVSRHEETKPAAEIDIIVKAGGDTPLYQIKNNDRTLSEPMEAQQLATAIYTRIFTDLDIDLTRAHIYLDPQIGSGGKALPPRS